MQHSFEERPRRDNRRPDNDRHARADRASGFRQNFRSRASAEKDEDAEDIPVPREIPADTDGKKAFLAEWTGRAHIPGKVQAMLSVTPSEEQADWLFSVETRGMTKILTLVPPYKGIQAPESIVDIDVQLRKEHLSAFRKSLLQMWVRATGDGHYGILVQGNFRSPMATHGFKTFLEFLKRSHPEILCCHAVQAHPVHLFDTAKYYTTMSLELVRGFGSEFLPIGNTGFFCHILDNAPHVKATWMALPERLLAAIHPAKGDRLLDCCGGPSFFGASLATHFAEVHSVSASEWSKESARQDMDVRKMDNFIFHRAEFGAEWLAHFFSDPDNDGRWTVLLNPSEDAPISADTIRILAESRPERILFLCPDLNSAESEIRRFRRAGYMLRKMIPVDMEPGNNTMQVLFFFVPDRAGLLGRAPVRGKAPVQRPANRERSEERADIPHFVEKKAPFRGRKG